MTTVAIIGAGPLGRWLALAAARAGYRVLLEDVMPSNLHHASEYIRQELAEQSASLVEYVTTVEDAVREADLVIDCVPDELESKLEILWLIDRMAPPRTVLATPTTQLSIADLASCTYRADKCVAMAVDPRGMASVPGSEIRLTTTARTSAQAIDLVRSFWQSVGFQAIVEQETTPKP